ncbi:MAG: hypothetical protein ACR2IA_11850 [Pyrinomonadaceae bacterium]
MTKSKAFVDTTILTNYLIKFREEKKEAKAALSQYEITELPVYAIKEFKFGPLDNAKYLYNKLLEVGSISLTFIAINKNYQQRNKKDTAIQLLAELQEEAKSFPINKGLTAKYGTVGDLENIIYDKIKIEVKMLVYKAWKKRNSITTKVVQKLSCFQQSPPFEKKNGELSLYPRYCITDECCLSKELKDKKRFALTKLKMAIDNLPTELKNKRENKKRAELLKKIGSNLGYKITDADCRVLGDAYFALFSPADADILTTNIKDHKPLASSLGKTAISPKEILE